MRIHGKAIHTLLCVLVLSFFINCKQPSSDNNPSNPNDAKAPAQAEWTIMVFIDGDNNLEPDAIQDFREMSQVGSTDKINIIAQMDLIGKYQDIGWTDTRRFRITKGMPPAKENAVMNIGEANMGDPVVLGDFVTWSIGKYSAKKYALVIWDHGQGYRFFIANSKSERENINKLLEAVNDTKEEEASFKEEASLPLRILQGDPFRSSTQSPFKSCSYDETNNDQLYNREIQDGLQTALKGRKLDLLGFDACLMGMVETAYAMHNVADNMVGSEELEPGTGWQYDDWLHKLFLNAGMDGKELSKTLVESYSNTYGSFSATTLSATQLVSFNNVATKISMFADELKKNLTTELSAIKKARSECAVYAPNPYHEAIPKDYFFHVDFVQFCEQLIAATQNGQLKTRATEAKDAVTQAITANFRGSLRTNKFGSNGLAIYFPESNTQYKSDVFETGGYKKDNTFFPVEFVQKETWADFLQEYFKKVP